MSANEMSKMKNSNFNSVFAVLLHGGNMSISDISDKAKLSIPTVTKALDYGMSADIVMQTETAPSSGGRKPLLYRINEQYGYFIYFVLDDNELHFVVKDYKDNVVVSALEKIKLWDILLEIEKVVDDMQKKNFRIICLFFCIPATIFDGIILEWYYNKNFNNFKFQKYFENKYHVKCVVENDMKVLAYLSASRESSQNCAIIQFGHNGVGASTVSNGEVVRGASGFAGEVGYMKGFSQSIKSIKYCAKILRNIIIITNPDKVIFYMSKKQTSLEEILKEATLDFPKYAIPMVEVYDSYVEDIYLGMEKLAIAFKEIEIN